MKPEKIRTALKMPCFARKELKLVCKCSNTAGSSSGLEGTPPNMPRTTDWVLRLAQADLWRSARFAKDSLSSATKGTKYFYKGIRQSSNSAVH